MYFFQNISCGDLTKDDKRERSREEKDDKKERSRQEKDDNKMMMILAPPKRWLLLNH